MGSILDSGVLCSVNEEAPCIIDNGASCGGAPTRPITTSSVGLQLSRQLLLMLLRLVKIPSSVLLVSNVRVCSGSPNKGSVKRDVTVAFSGGLSRGG